MIELVFVIIVLGILAALAIPRLERDVRQEAGDTLLSAFRYTKHLALIDDKHDSNNAWQKRYWKIVFAQCPDTPGYYFKIGSDDNMSSNNGTFSQAEAAINPYDGKPYYMDNTLQCSNQGNGSVSKEVFIGHKYGITNVTGGCTNVSGNSAMLVGFDHLGRTFVGFGSSSTPDFSSYVPSDCNFTFTFSDSSISPLTIVVEKQTGHIYIAGEPDS